ncbi:phosphoenolpyruvate-protein phosphotransferase PtsP [Vibrio sp. HA2012]|uniref:phosphoenolpyruvate--protein phosphotransferase n=1 Tax=Vibrio sp. HA2012 TaxID=1971595 RepID=UPI000C2CD0AA|nr:phosphoenolpyruvate--protein phosphotransferase [Vibrio sp. HA2012]PJC85043.1 phosphoenolpyruvate-protein phosphotransferase PtsP [Vibrio sp. HA2012]
MLTQLRDIVEQVSKVDDVHQAFAVLVKETCKAMQTECCTVYLANNEKQRLELIATQGLKFRGKTIYIGYHEGLVGLVRRNAEPLNLAKASEHPEFKYFPELGENIYHSFLGTPIIHRKQVLGVLVIQQKSPRQFSEMEVSFLVTLAAQIAVIIAHAQAQGHWLISDKTSEVIQGLGASSGIAVGSFWWDNTQPELSEVYPASSLDTEQEQERMAMAVENATVDFRRMRKKLDNEINKDALAIFDLFTHLLNDPMLRSDLKSQINKGDRADWALRQVVESYSNRFAKMTDVYMRERAQDIRELGQRLLYFLYNTEACRLEMKDPVILVVRELTASILAGIPKDKLLAVVSMEGAANSHAAILSRALGIPVVMGANCNPEALHGKTGVINGYNGQILVDPDPQILHEYRLLQTEESEFSRMVEGEITEPAKTKDGYNIEVLLNAGLNADANTGINPGVDGVGLYRTEFSFLLQHRFPSEEEQAQQYRAILQTYAGQKVVLRTLDIGGDKALPYLPIEEDNPFLGWRGIRFTLDHPDIFLIQVRAMLRASIGINNLSILLPMISSCQEFDDAMMLIWQAYNEVKRLFPDLIKPQIGVMVEVPSMLYLLPMMANDVDFVSVGSNDLTQYLLAVDRNNTRVADIYESMHPAVIMALKQIRDICTRYQLPVCVCGELAGDPIGALLLTGLGYRSLSMNASNVARIKYLLRQSDCSELNELAEKALMQSYGHKISNIVFRYLEEKGLAGLVRAGNK